MWYGSSDFLCSLSRQLRFWTDRSHLDFQSHGYFREFLVVLRRSLSVESWQSYLILILLDCALYLALPPLSIPSPTHGEGPGTLTMQVPGGVRSQIRKQARQPPPKGFSMSLGRVCLGSACAPRIQLSYSLLALLAAVEHCFILGHPCLANSRPIYFRSRCLARPSVRNNPRHPSYYRDKYGSVVHVIHQLDYMSFFSRRR